MFADVFSITSFGRDGAGGVFVPIKCLQIIAHELFIETGRALADRVSSFSQKREGIGRQTLVDQEQFSIDNAKLEFRVSNDDSFLRSILDGRRE